MVEAWFREVAGTIALAIDAAVVLIVTIGAIEAMARSLTMLSGTRAGNDARREIWLRFAMWILLALEFALAADIVRTAIAPTWDDIGKLAAIAAIRTGLNWFLAKDIEAYSERTDK